MWDTYSLHSNLTVQDEAHNYFCRVADLFQSSETVSLFDNQKKKNRFYNIW